MVTRDDDRSFLIQLLECQNVGPEYRGWNITKLNKVADEARKYVGLPTACELDPNLNSLVNHVKENKEKLQETIKNLQNRM